MFLDTLERFARLDERVRHGLFDLTIDVGHVHCSAEGDIAGLIRRWAAADPEHPHRRHGAGRSTIT